MMQPNAVLIPQLSYDAMTTTFKWMTGFFQNGCHEHFVLVIQFQYLHFMLDYSIKRALCAFTNTCQYLSENSPQYCDKWYILLLGKVTHLIIQEKMGNLA